MIVHRFTFTAKPGCRSDAVALLKDLASKMDGTVRIYSGAFGPSLAVTWEQEHESLASVERAVQEWEASPLRPAFQKRLLELRDSGGTDEIWNLE